MGFNLRAKDTFISENWQFSALILASTELPDTPRVPRLRRRVSFPDGETIKSFDKSALSKK